MHGRAGSYVRLVGQQAVVGQWRHDKRCAWPISARCRLLQICAQTHNNTIIPLPYAPHAAVLHQLSSMIITRKRRAGDNKTNLIYLPVSVVILIASFDCASLGACVFDRFVSVVRFLWVVGTAAFRFVSHTQATDCHACCSTHGVPRAPETQGMG